MEIESNCRSSSNPIGTSTHNILCSNSHNNFLLKKPHSSSNAVTMIAIAGRQEIPRPTNEELEFLEFRKHLKEKARERMKKESRSLASHSQQEEKKLPNDNYGSFFGPSQIVIARRVLQERQSILRTFCENNFFFGNAGKELKESHSPKKVCDELETKPQKLQEMCDYSFLMSNVAEFPLFSAAALPISDAQVPNYGASKSKASSMIKPAEPPRQSVPSSKLQMKLRNQMTELHNQMTPQAVPEHQYYKVMQKRSMPSSKRQMKPRERMTPHAVQKDGAKKRPAKQYGDEEDMDEEEDPINIIRSMFRYNPNKYVDTGDDVMEVSFHDIEKEEKRSARIARKEDERKGSLKRKREG